MKKLLVLSLFILNLFAVNVLVLNSYSPNLSWTTRQSHTLMQELRKKNINIYIEFMYTKKFRPTKERFERYMKSIKYQYKNIHFDAIMTTDDNALDFVRKYLNKIPQFKNSKVFFEGVNNLSLYNILNKNIFAGVFEKKNPLSNLNIALHLNPNLKTIYVVSDASVSGNKTIKQCKNAFKNIKNIDFIYINSSHMDTILNKLKNYQKNSVMMLLTFGSIEKNGKYLSPTKAAQLISAKYNDPILVHNDVYTNLPNTNIVGGNCTDAKNQAMINSKKLFEYLNGIPMNKIGFRLHKANIIYLNVENIKKFGINAYDLGIKNAVFINPPTSIYEIYKTQIWSLIIVFSLIIIFLIILGKKNRSLYLYSRQIKELNNSLEERIKKAIEENRQKDQIMFQQSKFAAMGEMIGAIAHQWRQPLNALALNIQLLWDDYNDGKLNEVYLEKFEEKQMETISFMSKTIDDFRNFFARDKTIEEFDIKTAVQEVVVLFEKQFNSHNIKIDVESDGSKIIGYKNEFKQVMLNIINNSKDAIISNNIENGFIKIKIKNNVVEIIDNGGGIPPEIQDRIFEPYFTSKENGTGIGLYMSKTIIEKHMESKIDFEVKNNKTIFKIYLKGK